MSDSGNWTYYGKALFIYLYVRPSRIWQCVCQLCIFIRVVSLWNLWWGWHPTELTSDQRGSIVHSVTSSHWNRDKYQPYKPKGIDFKSCKCKLLQYLWLILLSEGNYATFYFLFRWRSNIRKCKEFYKTTSTKVTDTLTGPAWT